MSLPQAQKDIADRPAEVRILFLFLATVAHTLTSFDMSCRCPS